MKLAELFTLLCFGCSIFCLTEGRKMHRGKRQSCDYGMYNHTIGEKSIECCNCPAGYHVSQHCDQTGRKSTCELCKEGEYYKNRPNGEEKCDICRHCSDQANMEPKEQCTVTTNAICGCTKGYYCDKGHECEACHACSTCHDMEVEVPCNATSNTVCKVKKDHAGLAGGIAAAVLLITVFGIVALIIFYCRKKKPPPPSVEEVPFIEDMNVDLKELLPKISSELGLIDIKKMVRRTQMLSVNEMEVIEYNFRLDAEEQAFQILKTWYQKHGLSGAYKTLIKNLNDSDLRLAASQVKQIVTQGQEREETMT
ncbi:tumor necrosis factor receptor superfamily member 6 [Hoplias malabaricus]|uniref:tumor necrosis factor receptor superfamily member 6 n=1 Tax=Hoplias malabaricus TaxID=27720 RepID=UPI0034635276